MIDILSRIEELRFKKGWSTYMLAKKSGLDQATIDAWYKKGRIPSIESLEKICDALDVSISWFFAADDEAVALTAQQRELLYCWDALSKKQKASTLQLIKDMPNTEF